MLSVSEIHTKISGSTRMYFCRIPHQKGLQQWGPLSTISSKEKLPYKIKQQGLLTSEHGRKDKFVSKMKSLQQGGWSWSRTKKLL